MISNYQLTKTASSTSMLNLLHSEIKTLPKVNAGYGYEGEQGINPIYCDIDACQPLYLDEKRIWALRGDGILATGIKNVCVGEGNTDLWKKVDKSAHVYLEKTNRYGHPSLAVPDGEYDGSVHYAGWVCRRVNHLQVFLQSGRYRVETLFSEAERESIETYIAFKFMDIYQQEKVLFYDRIGEELLTDFLKGPFDQARPCRTYTWETIEKNLKRSEAIAYEKMMIVAQINMRLSIEKLIADGDLASELIKPDLISETWTKLKYCFDAAIYQDGHKSKEIKELLKLVFKQLIGSGIPFVDGKQLVIWSTTFARNAAEKYAASCSGTTDGMAQRILRKILIGWPDGQLNVLFEALKDNTAYPKLHQLFWIAMSELFMGELEEGAPLHIFFQEALTIGNFCWDYELPEARRKGALIYLHRYNLSSHSWEPAVLFDSPDSDYIPVRRRAFHCQDVYHSDDLELKGESLVWKQVFKENKRDQEIVRCHGPQILTLGKLKSLTKKILFNIQK